MNSSFSSTATPLDFQKEKIYSGMLKKKRPKGFIAKVWQDRHFVLYDDVLQYFKKKTDVTPCGMIPIQAITSVTTEWKQKKNPCRFDIEIGDKRTFCLQADSVNEKNIWVQKIKGLMSNLDDTSGLQLEIDTRGKFWKNTNEIREARARSSVNWGDRRYLMADTTDDTKSSSDNSVSEDHDSKDHEQADTKFQTHYTIQKKVADGPFGQMYTVMDDNKRSFLMHVFLKRDPLHPRALQLFKDMEDVNHPYIFRLIHRGETEDSTFAVYTFAIDFPLFTHLRTVKRLPDQVSKLFVAEILLTCEYLHSIQRTFQNMGPEMIYLDEEGHCCVSDFYLCLLEEDMPENASPAEYATPEKLIEATEIHASDYWRLGILMYECLVGFPPFKSKTHDREEIKEKITSFTCDKLKFPPWVTNESKDLMCKLIVPEPSKRLGYNSIDDIKNHSWFAGLDWKALKDRSIPSPTYVDEKLQRNRRAMARNIDHIDNSRSYRLFITIDEGKNLPSLNSNGNGSNSFVEIQYKTATEIGPIADNTTNPKWNYSTSLDMLNVKDDAKIRVVVKHQSSSGSSPQIGQFETTLLDIAQHKYWDEWHGIVGQDCMSHGEMHVVFHWSLRTDAPKILPKTETHKTFKQFFNLSNSSRKSLYLSMDIISDNKSLPPPPVPPRPSVDSNDTASDHSNRKNSQSWMANKVRTAVSKKKRRFVKNGFDLDLTYITPQIIAMGFPAESISSLYRNRMSEVQKFFKFYHDGHYKIYNLCCERKYDPGKFDGSVALFTFQDHNAPPFRKILDYCEDVKKFLDENKSNVAATHCKAGKGRTGTMIACYLLFAGICETPLQALDRFAGERTTDGKGVTIPSQRRYVYYFGRFLKEYYRVAKPFNFDGPAVTLSHIRISTVPNFDVGGGCDPYFTVKRPDGKLFYDYRKHVTEIKNFKKNGAHIDITCDASFAGDVRITFWDYDKFSADDKMFAFWIHTGFIQNNHLTLTRLDCDHAFKDNSNKHFHQNFQVELFFKDCSSFDECQTEGEMISDDDETHDEDS